MSGYTGRGEQYLTVLIVVVGLFALFYNVGLAEADPSNHPNNGTRANNSSVVPQGTIPEDRLPVQVGETYYGVNGTTVLWFWSEDHDTSRSVDRDPTRDFPDDNLNQTERTAIIKYLSDRDDERLIQYPNPINIWNTYNWAAFKKNLNITVQRSYHPPSADLKSRGWIKDAHATIFWINGTEIVNHGRWKNTTQQENGPASQGQKRYIPPASDLRAMVDYRVDLPRNDTTLGFDRTLTNYSLISSNITESCVVGYRNPRRVGCDYRTFGTGSGEHFDNISYTMGLANPWNIAYVAEVSVRVRVYERTRVTLGNHSKWINHTYYRTESLQVDDRIEFNRKQPYKVDIHRADFPNGTTDYTFEFGPNDGLISADEFPPATWMSIEINGSHILSEWKYVTLEKSGWGRMIESSDGPDTSFQSIGTPVSTYVYPLSKVKSASGSEGWNNVQSVIRRGTVDPPGMKNIAATRNKSDTFRPSKGVQVRHGSGAVVPDEYQAGDVPLRKINFSLISGYVADKNLTTHSVKESTLDLSVVSESDTEFTVEVSLTDLAGNPIDLSAMDRGHIIINAQKVKTEADGSARLSFPIGKVGRISASYKPVSWRTLSSSETAYMPSQADYYRSSSRSFDGFFLYIADVLFLPIFLFGCLYLLWKRDIVFRHI